MTPAEDLNEEELIKLFESCKPKSIWDRLFKEHIHLDEIPRKLEEIRKERNKIAHNKFIKEKDFKKLRKMLNEFINAIDIANNKQYDRPLTWGINDDIMENLSNTLLEFSKQVGISLELSREQMSQGLLGLSKVIGRLAQPTDDE